ncbi:TPA: restriction endonuclease subunit S [Klebsiella pneumoniae]|uniref:restriction endonuclease subunit S n=1 Tax=Klebsiella pneumoniae TaxID=573 RepID=UPI001CF61041|nr:restriction endonuclease subunit S [Klebsiella pneumoniae]EIX9727866.1 restriction endonuclease subunit S [Klebsiella pneumoniae]MCB3624839.1 restriction endonuclease subunit S [Klebsiella pneumoniae]MCE0058258.1 restriction endonuclease subunit S [Klebsiella pneumoniae]MCG6829407.1 restriction endonuclease subunit S [Klebsiella pneumoniae]MDH8467347.1 restriction endonuclease subunit S [Klebsiella pneumoniae]
MSEMSYLEKLLDGVEVEWKTLGQTCKIETGKLNANAAVDDGEYMFFTTAKETSKIDKFRWDTEALLIAGNANVGEVKHYIGKFEAYQRTYVLTNFDENVSVRFLYFVLSHSLKKYLEERTNSAAMTYIVLSTLENFPIPIPCPDNPEKSLAIQSEIVRILDKFTALTAELTAELNMRKKQYNYYRDQLLSLEEDEIEWKALDDVCALISAGGDVPENSVKGQVKPTNEYPYPIYANATDEKGLYGYTDSYKIDSDAVTISARGAKVGYHTVRDAKFTPIIRLIVLVANKNLVRTRYLNYVLDMTAIGGTDGGIPQLTVPMVKKITVPIPFASNPNRSLAEQDRIIAILDKFEILTNSINEGLPREINLRQKQYEYYRDLLLSFPKSNV